MSTAAAHLLQGLEAGIVAGADAGHDVTGCMSWFPLLFLDLEAKQGRAICIVVQ
jgi:hypothetical protein